MSVMIVNDAFRFHIGDVVEFGIWHKADRGFNDRLRTGGVGLPKETLRGRIGESVKFL